MINARTVLKFICYLKENVYIYYRVKYVISATFLMD